LVKSLWIAHENWLSKKAIKTAVTKVG